MDTLDDEIETLAVHLAPLPKPLIMHLLGLFARTHSDISRLKWQASVQRSNVFDRFHTTVLLEQTEKQEITVKWLLDELSDVLQKKFARSTLFNWHQRGFVRNESRGRPRVEDVARLLFYYALIDCGLLAEGHAVIPEREWLPATLDEQNWWCWQQMGPDEQAKPFRLPETNEMGDVLAEQSEKFDLSLFWTPWPGAAWSKGRWIQVGGLGAITCGYLLFHAPNAFEYFSLVTLLRHWRDKGEQSLPYFRDVSHHGDKFHRYELPALKLKMFLLEQAQTRLAGPTFYS